MVGKFFVYQRRLKKEALRALFIFSDSTYMSSALFGCALSGHSVNPSMGPRMSTPGLVRPSRPHKVQQALTQTGSEMKVKNGKKGAQFILICILWGVYRAQAKFC